MRANNIPVVESLLFNRGQIARDLPKVLEEIEAKLPYPVFVKPANLGSSVGITRCTNHSCLVEGLLDAARFDRRVLVERGVNAREIEVSVLGNENPIASVPGEIQPQEEFYTYSAKYISNTSRLIIPAELDAATTEEITRIAIEAFIAIDGAGMARVDFLLDRESGKILLSEVNTIRVYQYQHVHEIVGSQRHFLCRIDRSTDLPGVGPQAGSRQYRAHIQER